jgi:ribosomal RNA-processing protein 1
MRLWKGLFYCMWMSDKPLVQENLSEQLAGLVHLFDDPAISLQFFKAFLKTMSLEWFGIDQWRIDKFMMLIRRFVRQTLFVLKNNEWKDELVDLFVQAIDQTVLDTESVPLCSLTMHFNDIILEELGKVSC